MERRSRIKFTNDQSPVLPRSSHASGPKRSESWGVARSVLMIALLIASVYFLSKAVPKTDKTGFVSTGDDEGLEEFMDHWGHSSHHYNNHQHEYKTGRGHEHNMHAYAHQHDTHAHAPAATEDDGSIIINTAAHTAHPDGAHTLPPAHSVGGGAGQDHSHHDHHHDVHHEDHGHHNDHHHDVHHEDHGHHESGHEHHHEDDILPDPVDDEPSPNPHPHPPAHAAHVDAHPAATGLYALSATDIDGRERHLSEFAGKVTIVVNVASKCGYTDANYRGLQEAYQKYHAYGLEVLAFPCNQFGEQEPGTHAEIKDFAQSHYHTTFPLFSKIDVNGPSTHPVFQYLKRELPAIQGGGGGTGPGRDLPWNFQKFIVNRDGKPVKLYNQDWHQGVIEHAVYDLLVEKQQ